MQMEFLRRRLKWRPGRCTADSADHGLSYFEWRKQDYEYDEEKQQLVTAKEPMWQLWSDSILEGLFQSEVALKCRIIRLVYGLADYLLIPSELLYEAGMLYADNRWTDAWSEFGTKVIEHRDILPGKPQERCIRFSMMNESGPRPLQVTSPAPSSTSLKPWQAVPKILKPLKPREHVIKRLQKGDDLELSWEEELGIWFADRYGAGLDEYDELDDDDCFIVLETGDCNAETCAIITIDEETPAREEEPAQVQDAGEASSAEAGDLDADDYYRFG